MTAYFRLIIFIYKITDAHGARELLSADYNLYKQFHHYHAMIVIDHTIAYLMSTTYTRWRQSLGSQLQKADGARELLLPAGYNLFLDRSL